VSVVPYGNANWAITARITTKCPQGSRNYYFLKIIRGELAGERVLGEFSGISELFCTLPDIIPKPHGAGKCQDTGSYFFLSKYVHIDHRAPDPVQLGRRLAELHSASVSPNGKFGFHTTPFDGRLPLVVDWDSSWTSFYAKLLKGVYEQDMKFNGKVSKPYSPTVPT
jgi:fructosamine-3-kinase